MAMVCFYAHSVYAPLPTVAPVLQDEHTGQ